MSNNPGESKNMGTRSISLPAVPERHQAANKPGLKKILSPGTSSNHLVFVS